MRIDQGSQIERADDIVPAHYAISRRKSWIGRPSHENADQKAERRGRSGVLENTATPESKRGGSGRPRTQIRESGEERPREEGEISSTPRAERSGSRRVRRTQIEESGEERATEEIEISSSEMRKRIWTRRPVLPRARKGRAERLKAREQRARTFTQTEPFHFNSLCLYKSTTTHLPSLSPHCITTLDPISSSFMSD